MVAKWMEFVHPRAKEFFGMGPQGMLAEVLTKIARNTAAGTNPIPGGKECPPPGERERGSGTEVSGAKASLPRFRSFHVKVSVKIHGRA